MMTEHSIAHIDVLNKAVARRQETHWFHVREAGKLSRRAFTDVLKAFAEYVDPQNQASSDPDQTYLRLTTKLYSPLGLSSKVIHQLRETTELKNLRDHMSPRLLLALSVMESELAEWIGAAMKRGELRTFIKAHLGDEAKKAAAIQMHLDELDRTHVDALENEWLEETA
jgi:hypothetical protein